MKMRQPFCADCRSVLRGTTECQPQHRVIEIADDEGRQQLAAVIWQPSGEVAVPRRGMSFALQYAPGLLLIGGIALVLSNHVFPAVVVGVIALGVLSFATGEQLSRARVSTPLRATGASAAPWIDGERFVGTITDGVEEASPLGSATAVGWAAEISLAAAGVMLRDGATKGLTVALTDGRTLHVAAGMLRLAMRGRTDLLPSDHVATYVASLGAIPWDEARALQLHIGDTVEITAPTTAASTAPAVGYRDSAATELVTTDLPFVRKR